MFWENIDERLVFLDAEFDSPDDVFEKLGGALVENGYCRDSYVDALKEREKVFPTGIQAGDLGVALPHTDSEHVKESAIAIALLKEPVKFHEMGTSPDEGSTVDVTFIVMLAITDGGHLEMLQKAVMLIQDPELVEGMAKAADPKDVIGLIKEKEEGEE